jgi:prevent-host-death family protein
MIYVEYKRKIVKSVYTVQNFVLYHLRTAMAFSVSDVIPLSQARANLSELADQVKAGAEKIVTKNGESYIALIDAQRLDYYHRLERARIHLLLLDDASKGIADIQAGRVKEAKQALQILKKRRISKT